MAHQHIINHSVPLKCWRITKLSNCKLTSTSSAVTHENHFIMIIIQWTINVITASIPSVLLLSLTVELQHDWHVVSQDALLVHEVLSVHGLRCQQVERPTVTLLAACSELPAVLAEHDAVHLHQMVLAAALALVEAQMIMMRQTSISAIPYHLLPQQ